MLKKRKVKTIYIKMAVCDKCRSELVSTGECLTSNPAQYPYKCSNPNCDGYEIFQEYERPGQIEYEFEEEKDANFNKLQNQAVARVKNKDGITVLKKKVITPTKFCPYCQAQLDCDTMKSSLGDIHFMYECPNGCQLSWKESNEYILKDDENSKNIISYEEEEVDICTTLLP